MYVFMRILFLSVMLVVFFACSAGAQCPVGDLNEDCVVDYQDLRILTDRWLDPNCLSPDCEADLDSTPGVNMTDFAWLAGSWLEDYREITLVINEFMASNNSDSGIRDEYGDYDDWIEIYNYGHDPVNIGGLYIIDDISKPVNERWMIPTTDSTVTTIPAGGFLVIWADGEPLEGILHVDFKLSASDPVEDICLYESDRTTVLDAIYNFNVPTPQEQNKSYGRFPDGNDNWLVFDHPTPGKPNRLEGVLINEIMYHPYHSTTEPIEPENLGEEYIELFNNGIYEFQLDGWRFSDGVNFSFPNDVTLGVGQYLVVAADVNTFTAKYPTVTNVIGGWDGHLSNSGEKVELVDDIGVVVDSVRYADEGDWGTRVLGPEEYGDHRGWIWESEHDGEGMSLELVNPDLTNEHGQNWAASLVNGGTPGTINTVSSSNTAPLILDVKHRPRIPGPNDLVVIRAEIIDELTIGLTVTLHYRVDTSVYEGVYVYPHYDPNDYTQLPMYDDGTHGDNEAGDGDYAAQIPAQPHSTIIEFFIEAGDAAANSRTYPAPSFIDGTPEQVTNLLYQVDATFVQDADWVPGSQPTYYLIMTGMEWGRLEYIGSHSSLDGPDSQMNATFISVDGVDKATRYNIGVRDRGHGTRDDPPNNYRVNFPSDRAWKNVTSVNLNTKYSYLQLVGNAMFRLSDLAQCETTAVQVRINGQNILSEYPGDWDQNYGSYVHVEVVDGDFTDNHYPEDGDGNAYKCMRLTHQADLRYEGTDPDPYRENYFKRTNTAADDWSDLIGLTYALSDNTPDENYVEEVNRVLKVEQWLRLIAINVLMDNAETTLANGNGDDYYLYCGIEDPRFVLIQHDLDSVFGLGQSIGSTTNGIFDATAIPAMDRLLTHPQFVPRYYWHLKNLIETTFSEERIGLFMDDMLGDFVPTTKIDQIKNFVTARNAHVLSLIPQEFTISSDLTLYQGYHRTMMSTATGDNVYGTANAIETRTVYVNGQRANWWPTYGDVDNGQCKWAIASGGIPLNPGINRIIVQTFDGPIETGNELERGYIDIWYDDGFDMDLSGTLASDTILDAASGLWHVTGDLIVPSGVTLTIMPGTTLFFDSGTGITVQQGGRLLAEGTEYQRIRFTKVPGNNLQWDGIKFDNTLEDNRLCFVDHEFGDGQDESTDVQYSRLLIDNMTWAGTNERILNIDHPSVICRNSVFPSIDSTEPVHGVGLRGDEYIIFDGCIFGTASGYNDIIDFRDANRPGPILQLYNSIFIGGGDDGADLDSTDAHVEGNLFMNFHGGGGDGTSSAVATGVESGNPSEVYVARNIFVNNDHSVLLKEDCYLYAQNNVFVNSDIAVVTFGEPYRDPPRAPGGGAYMDGNIFWNNTEIFEHFFQEPLPNYGPTGEVVVSRSILPSQWHYLGLNNIDADPIFVDPNADFHLKSMSPAIGTGLCGLDMGALSRLLLAGRVSRITSIPLTTRTAPGVRRFSCLSIPMIPAIHIMEMTKSC